MRTLSSISPLACTSARPLAMEKARLWPRPGISSCTYCPAWKWMGLSSCRWMASMVGVRVAMRATVAAKSRTGITSASGSSSMSASMVASLCSVQQQARVLPSSRSKSISANGLAAPWSTSPSLTRTLQVPHSRSLPRRPRWCRVGGSVGGLVALVEKSGCSAERSPDAREARRAETDCVLVRQAVVGQRLGRVRLPGLTRLEPLDGGPVDAREVRVLAVDAGKHGRGQRAERHVGRQRQAERGAEHQVVFPADVEQRRGKVLPHVLGREVVCGEGDDAHFAAPSMGWPRQVAKFFWSCEPSKSKLSRPISISYHCSTAINGSKPSTVGSVPGLKQWPW